MMNRLLFRLCCAALLVYLSSIPVQASVALNATNFPDDNFRAALSAYATNGVIDETQLTELDVSNQGITDLTGLELLTGLTYLDISNNNLTTGANITGLTALITLKASNCNIRTLAATYESYSGVRYAGLVIGAGNASIKYLDLSNNVRFSTSGNLQYLTHLETLLLKDCTYYDYWGTPGLHMSSLKWVDVSGCTAMDRVFLPAATQLQHLDASRTKVKGFSSSASSTSSTAGYIVLPVGLSTLEYLNLANCSSFDSFQAIANHYQVTSLDTLILTNDTGINGWSSGITAQTGLKYCDLTNTGQTSTSIGFTSAHSSLETLILANNSSFGYSSSFQYLSALKYLDISNCNIFFREGGGSEDYYLLHYLTPTNNPNLETLIASHSKLGTRTEGLTGFTNLKTVDVSNNVTSGTVNMTQFWVNGSPNLETLDIRGNSALTYIQLNDDDLPRTNFTLLVDNDCSALNSLYLNGNNYGSVGQATQDFTNINNLEFLYLENNSGFTGGPLTMSAADCGDLKGIDLGNNGFTSFTAESLPQSLTALMLGDNPSMERLEMHNNPGIKTMTASPVMSDGSGLYLLGNTALTYMDISGTAEQPNYFQRIGNNGSLNGVPIETLKASYNKFYTFRNLTTVAGDVTEYCTLVQIQSNPNKYKAVYSLTEPSSYNYKAYWPTMPAMPDSASLEQLVNLKYLDLSHCQLKDSVYLHKNTELQYLDVSHNRTIARYATSQDKGAQYRASIPANATYNRNFEDYKKYLWLVDTRKRYPDRQEAYDQEYYTLDYNDTTGLYILDLLDNNKLEYLDISYTGIEQTAMTHCHVSNARFIWIQDLPELKYFYADYNGMRSMGIGTQYGKKKPEGEVLTAGLKSLERLSAIGMRGADVTTMQGSINFATDTKCVKLHYINLSYSDYDSIGFYASKIDTVIITGNPLHYVNMQSVDSIKYIDATKCAFKHRGYDPETGNTVALPASIKQRYMNNNGVEGYRIITMNGAREGGVYSGELETPWSGLRGVKAFGREKLRTVLLDNCNGLREVYCHDDPLLTSISGFDNLAYALPDVDSHLGYGPDIDSLRVVHVHNNPEFIALDLHKNNALQHLYAYNDKKLGPALGDNGLDVSASEHLITAWVSNSLLQKFVNTTSEQLDTLFIWQNPQLSSLDVTHNTGLRYFDLRNCMIRNLDVSQNTQLVYFDCSNMDSIQAEWTAFDNYGFTMPRQVPTSMSQPGKNSIADLNFGSKSLKVVRADNNDLYSLKGLNNNAGLHTLTYSYNHINGIDLSGCTSLPPRGSNEDLVHYNCTHNVRGLIPGELASWNTTENGVTTQHNMYYFQLKKNAGDALPSQPANYNTFLGSKSGQDSIETVSSTPPYQRELEADGFNPDKVLKFTVNASGPYHGTRVKPGSTPSGAPSRVNVNPSENLQLDLSTIYGTVAVIKYMNDDRNYVEYLYNDGRPSVSRDDEGGSSFGLAWYPPGTPTDVEETTIDGLGDVTVVSERYYDASGMEHSEPISGINIIVRQMSDGTTQTEKVMRP